MGDTEAVHAVLDASLAGTPYLERAREILGLALEGKDREHRALVATRDAQIVGVAAFGELLGSDRVMRILVLAVRDRREYEAARLLADAVGEEARDADARFVFAELPDDTTSRHTIAELEDAGFYEETRIADYVRDGVPIVFLRRDL